jgi:hypothetical protein
MKKAVKTVLSDVHQDNNFWVVDGTVLKNLHELLEALENMDEDTFKHHVNGENNDFHNWVKHVHKDQKLARLLSREIDRESTTTIIKRRIKEIEKPKGKLKKTLKNKVPSQKTVDKTNHNYKMYKATIGIITIGVIISLIGVTSQATQLTGAVVGTVQTQEKQFLGLGGIFAVVALLFVALHIIERHAKKES